MAEKANLVKLNDKGIKKLWIYYCRAFAIIAVVVCHQQYILHESEYVQLTSLYSVTMLIFLAGITQALWLQKQKFDFEHLVTTSIIKKLSSIIFAYLLATIMYLCVLQNWNGFDFELLIKSLYTFSGHTVFYFIKYYLALTMISPFIYSIVAYTKLLKSWNRVFAIGIYIIVLFYMSIFLTNKFASFGSSYLFVYGLGILFGCVCAEYNVNINTRIMLIICSTIVLIFSFCQMREFYFNKLLGIYEPIGINVLTPMWNMNPPNISIILYSLSLFGVLYLVLSLRIFEKKWWTKVFKPLELIGKYSLDIYLWHMLIQHFLIKYIIIDEIWIKRIVYYFTMLGVPIVMRMICFKYKNYLYSLFCENKEN